MVIVE